MFEPSPAVNTLFPHGQIRLSVLSVYNWGSFCGLHTAPIDPYGTLITGDNGAGKSTLIDGLIALLQASGKAAQRGAPSGFRSLLVRKDITGRLLALMGRGQAASDVICNGVHGTLQC